VARNRLSWQEKHLKSLAYAKKMPSIGQKLYGLTREALHPLVKLCQSLFAQGQSMKQVMEVMMPAYDYYHPRK